MSFQSMNGQRRTSRPFDEVCWCDHEAGGLVCCCTHTKEQAKERCSRCADGQHVMKRPPTYGTVAKPRERY